MAIKMLIFDSVDELKAYENKQVKEELDLRPTENKELLEVLMKNSVEVDGDKIQHEKSNYRKKWTEKDKRQFKQILKESKEKGLDNHKALEVASDSLGRTISSLIKMKFMMGIKYNELKSQKKSIVEDPKKKYRSAWTNKEKIDLHNFLKDCKKHNVSYRQAMKKLSEHLGRTLGSVVYTTSKMGIKYSEMKVHSPVFISSGEGKKWSKEEIDYLIAETKPFCDKGKHISKKVYLKLSKRFNRKKNSIKAKVYELKDEGKLKKILSKEQRMAMTRNIWKDRKKQEKKEESGYMISRKPSFPERFKNLGKTIPQTNIFSTEITSEQARLLIGMIDNDIKNRGLSKITQEKLSLLMNLSQEQFERFCLDVSKNTKAIKRYFKISVISLQKDSSGQYLVFS